MREKEKVGERVRERDKKEKKTNVREHEGGANLEKLD